MTARLKRTTIGRYTIALMADHSVRVTTKAGYDSTTQCPSAVAAQAVYDMASSVAQQIKDAQS